jgi:pSer/pThr/pTyr-binding forkhead associated (FHA) protein
MVTCPNTAVGVDFLMALALRFISGKYQGGEFPLEENREIVVGRSSDLDMVLVEELVSRKHARMMLREGRLELEDLGSTNGTFVNGEKISKTTVNHGDRILIGSNILRVVSTAGDEYASKADSSSSASRRAVRRPMGANSSESRMSGELSEIPLPDLLQLFGTSKKDGVLLVDTGSQIGRIVLKRGLIHYGQISTPEGQDLGLTPAKAVYRVLSWESGYFELDPPSDEAYESPLELSAQAVLMEAFRQKDELDRFSDKVPPASAQLLLPIPLEAVLSKLDAAELDVWQAAINVGTVSGLMNASPLTDLDTAKALVKLVDEQYLHVSVD